MTAYYNERDKYAVQWLRNLIDAGHIAPGVVDERDIRDVLPSDLDGFTQCHFFAGIGVWSYALRIAGWADDRPVWTGSCPCQPFSAAGKGVGFADERHLWPYWHHLIAQRLPSPVFGEQVEGPDGLAWLDLVHADMEANGYACGPVVLPAAGVGAPHPRHRLYWVADASRAAGFVHGGNACGLADADGRLPGNGDIQRSGEYGQQPAHGGAVRGFWSDAEWIACTDGKARPVEPGTFPLAHGARSRMGRLRAYGNAIVAEAAAEFIRAYLLTTSTEPA